MSFSDRADAGRKLAAALSRYKDQAPVVLALPRGGVAVAAEVAAALSAPLDLVIVRKIGAPQQPELAMGAVVDGPEPITVRNEDVIGLIGVSEAVFDTVRDSEIAEIRRRRERYLGARPHPELAGRAAIVVDDGIATGASMRAALRAVRARGPKTLVLAVPVAPSDTLAELKAEADDVVCLEPHPVFGAIGFFYADFRQLSDEDVIEALAKFPAPAASLRPAPWGPPMDWNVVVTAYKEGGRQALRALRKLGPAARSRHYNVFLATAKDPVALLDDLETRSRTEPVLIDVISRIAPAQVAFDYGGEEEFERQVVRQAASWLPRLADKSFHVRLHRRGGGLTAKSQAEEARLGELLLAEIAKAGAKSRIAFDDPDMILAIDAIDGRAGMGLWSRQDLSSHRFLRPD
jgi:putative phosphoribosyl transferase